MKGKKEDVRRVPYNKDTLKLLQTMGAGAVKIERKITFEPTPEFKASLDDMNAAMGVPIITDEQVESALSVVETGEEIPSIKPPRKGRTGTPKDYFQTGDTKMLHIRKSSNLYKQGKILNKSGLFTGQTQYLTREDIYNVFIAHAKEARNNGTPFFTNSQILHIPDDLVSCGFLNVNDAPWAKDNRAQGVRATRKLPAWNNKRKRIAKKT